MNGKLHHFDQGAIVISQDDAWKILVFFFGGNAGLSPSDVTSKDVEFAQALLLEAIAASYKMDEARWNLFKGTVYNPPVAIGVAIAVVLKAREFGWIRLKERTPKHPQIYKSIRDTLRNNWRSLWAERTVGGNLEW